MSTSVTNRQIADAFGVSIRTVQRVKRRDKCPQPEEYATPEEFLLAFARFACQDGWNRKTAPEFLDYVHRASAEKRARELSPPAEEDDSNTDDGFIMTPDHIAAAFVGFQRELEERLINPGVPREPDMDEFVRSAGFLVICMLYAFVNDMVTKLPVWLHELGATMDSAATYELRKRLFQMATEQAENMCNICCEEGLASWACNLPTE